MNSKHLSLLSVLVLSMELSYFVVSAGPFMEYGVPVSEQLSGGNDDRFVLQFGAVIFAVPVLYGLLTTPLKFRLKNHIFVAVYLLAFAIWAIYVAAVNADTPLLQSVLFGDWYLPVYLAAPFVPLAFLIHQWSRLTSRSTRTREKASRAG